MHHGIFLITEDEEGREHVGRMVHHCDTWTQACNFIRASYAAGVLADGTEVPINGLMALELEARPWGDNPPRIKAGQVV